MWGYLFSGEGGVASGFFGSVGEFLIGISANKYCMYVEFLKRA